MKFGGFTAVYMNYGATAFWYMKPCSVVEICRQVGETCRVSFTMHTEAVLTPWSTVPLQKLTGFQLIKKFPTFYGTRRFITSFTSARQLSLS